MGRVLHRRLLVWAAAPLLCGCFTYVPADLETVPPGGEVRVHLSRRAMAELPEDIPADATFVTGRFAGQGEDGLRVRVPIGTRQAGFLGVDLRQEIRVPAAEVVQIDRREFSYGRTALLVGGGIGAAAFIMALITEATGDDDPVDPGEELILVPLVSFFFR